VKAAFVPDVGDFVWLTFDPQAGREQAGRRPALVLSPESLQREIRTGAGVPHHESGQRIPI